MNAQGECKVCVAPLHCECNGKCQKGLKREQKGNECDGSVGLLTMQTLGLRRDASTVAPYSQIRDEAE